jgi:hypothetical protein
LNIAYCSSPLLPLSPSSAFLQVHIDVVDLTCISLIFNYVEHFSHAYFSVYTFSLMKCLLFFCFSVCAESFSIFLILILYGIYDLKVSIFCHLSSFSWRKRSNFGGLKFINFAFVSCAFSMKSENSLLNFLRKCL